MKKAGVEIDDWKLSIFKRILNGGGFKYSQFIGPTKGVITLTVQTDSIAKLKPFIEKANAEAAKSKRH